MPIEEKSGGAGLNPELTATAHGGPFLYIAAADGATIYNTPNSKLNANFDSPKSYDGTGTTIGIIGKRRLSPLRRPITASGFWARRAPRLWPR